MIEEMAMLVELSNSDECLCCVPGLRAWLIVGQVGREIRSRVWRVNSEGINT